MHDCGDCERRPGELGAAIGRVSHMMRRHLSMGAFNQQNQLTGAQGMVLHAIIHEQDEIFQRDIERIFHIRRSSAAALIKAMEQNGLICRQPVERDARLKRLLPTEKGVTLDRQVRRNIEEVEAHMRQGLSEEELAAFFSIMGKIQNNLQQMEKGGEPLC